MSDIDDYGDDLFGDAAEPVSVAILGSTGSIGTQALEVVRAHPDRFKVTALTAHSDGDTLLAQAKEFDVPLLGLTAGGMEAPAGTTLVDGSMASAEVAEAAEASVVLNAVVGAAGLQATLATLRAGKTLALANKESLVAAGELVMAKAGPGQIRPVDSEHSALWQLLHSIAPDQVRRALVTGSGGPFRGRTREDLGNVDVQQALAHPVWAMGPKITVDSSTLMNKGLEVIEAHFLFGFTYDEIDVVIHPQGTVHALVETVDGAVFVHAAPPDMRLPIQLALAWPDRLGAPGGKRLDWATLGTLTFEPPDTDTFRCLALAYQAARLGDTYPAVLNAANEVAVGAFLDGRLAYLGIPDVVERVLDAHEPIAPSLEGVLEVDAWARGQASATIATRGPSRPRIIPGSGATR
ncbi:MAG: 1-deoxy-D-xylulose-5-phosphate reductoisomerase [Actinomycetota bacterium]|nr:1-deoxy-D-xylulose-5-phosphate reductoisomerase [Actinomycetota bacterium]MEA2589452.1 1-deoxy-D-xylulose-5-phosphate reductoisomerase [Actinomycetota bacterium]